VRRTSRPGDEHRAVATIVVCDRPVAVENHLLVCRPRDGSGTACQTLLDVLQRPETTSWLDRRICCRHLTVSAVRSIPWWE
jgi:hypothetical protein